MKLRLSLALSFFLSASLISCKKSNKSATVNGSSLVSYTVNGADYQENQSFTASGLSYSFSSDLTFTAMAPNGGYFASSANSIRSAGGTLYGGISIYFNYPYDYTSIHTGTYTFVNPTPLINQNGIADPQTGYCQTDTGFASLYTNLLSDTVTINAYSNHLASGTFEATYVNRAGGDSIIHVSNGTFNNVYVEVSSALNPG
jgi:hypothetical protein